MVGVVGSNPIAPTIKFNDLGHLRVVFLCLLFVLGGIKGGKFFLKLQSSIGMQRDMYQTVCLTPKLALL